MIPRLVTSESPLTYRRPSEVDRDSFGGHIALFDAFREREKGWNTNGSTSGMAIKAISRRYPLWDCFDGDEALGRNHVLFGGFISQFKADSLAEDGDSKPTVTFKAVPAGVFLSLTLTQAVF